MKRVLLGSTALVAASMIAAAPASSAEKIKLGLGGYMEQWIGYADNDDTTATSDNSGFGTNSDTEIWFLGETTLDNGITFGVNIQLEGNTSGDTIDESFMYIEGNFGQVLLGSENSAQYKMNYGAPDVGIGANSGDQTAWVNFASVGGSGSYFRNPFGSTNVEAARANDINRITYFTPRVSGFQLGASYAPLVQEDGFNAAVDRDAPGTLTNGVALGANYKKDFNGVDIGVSGGYGQWTATGVGTDDPTAWNLGLTVSTAGFTVGGSYADAESFNGVNADSTGYSLGASYGMGPWSASLTYYHGERTAALVATAGDADMDSYHASAAYALGPGITLVGTLGFTSLDDTSGGLILPGTGGRAAADSDSVYVVVGPKLKF